MRYPFVLTDDSVVEASSAYLTASWERLVEDLSELTRTLEAPSIGRALMEVELPDAVQIAESYRVRVGMAESLEVVTLAAFIATPGRVKVITKDKEKAILDALPLYFLKGVGLSQRLLNDLGWLDVTKAGELRAWKKPQVQSFLGKAGKHLTPYLFGPYWTQLSRYNPPPRIARTLPFDAPRYEPVEFEPVVERLSREIALDLGNKAASTLIVHATSQGEALDQRQVTEEILPLRPSDTSCCRRLHRHHPWGQPTRRLGVLHGHQGTRTEARPVAQSSA